MPLAYVSQTYLTHTHTHMLGESRGKCHVLWNGAYTSVLSVKEGRNEGENNFSFQVAYGFLGVKLPTPSIFRTTVKPSHL